MNNLSQLQWQTVEPVKVLGLTILILSTLTACPKISFAQNASVEWAERTPVSVLEFGLANLRADFQTATIKNFKHLVQNTSVNLYSAYKDQKRIDRLIFQIMLEPRALSHGESFGRLCEEIITKSKAIFEWNHSNAKAVSVDAEINKKNVSTLGRYFSRFSIKSASIPNDFFESIDEIVQFRIIESSIDDKMNPKSNRLMCISMLSDKNIAQELMH